MKKHFIIFFVLVYVFISSYFLFNLNKTTNASSEEVLYGKILSSNCMFLKTPTKTSEKYFLLEESYYVIILSEENDYFYVNYLDLNGYVNKENIMLVNEKINNPFLNYVTFNITKDCFLYSEPKILEENKILNLTNTENVTYYGKIFADELNTNNNLWYYCKINNNGNEIKGYVHSTYTNNLTPIIENTEFSTKYLNINKTNSLLNLNLTTQTIVIIIISIPTIFLTFILLKGFRQ